MRKGAIRSYGLSYTKDTIIEIRGRARSFTLINVGSTDAFLYGPTVNLPLLAATPIKEPGTITIGGYDDSFRNDMIDLIFTGGTGRVIVIVDDQLKEPGHVGQD